MSVEDRVNILEARVTKLENSLSGKKAASSSSLKSEDIEALIVSKIDEIDAQDLVVIALKLKPKQKKSEVKAMLQDWGAKVGSWFEGGNLNTRMAKNGIVKKEKLDDKKSIAFSLTKKGDVVAQNLIDKIKSGDY